MARRPGLVVRMYRYARLYDGAAVLDVGTGSGYGTALLCELLGDQHVTSIDVDPYLTRAAAGRLAGLGLRPDVRTCDATGELPGGYDRIVSMVAMPTVPPGWLAALEPGGRLVTVIAGTAIVITATKVRGTDGSAYARAGRHRERHDPPRARRLERHDPARPRVLRPADGVSGRRPVRAPATARGRRTARAA